MKILSIIVDELSTSCNYCELRNDNYCPVKGCSCTNRQQWIDRHSNKRDKDCPLKVKE